MTFETIFQLLVLPPAAYLLGSIPWGLVLTRLFSTTDIQTQGSGNIGATNVLTRLFSTTDIQTQGSGNIGATNVRRMAGNTLGLLTLAGDIGKGALPVYWACKLAGSTGAAPQLYISLVALAAFAGHLHPVYLKGKGGGKGVATALGCFIILSPVSTITGLLVFILLACITSRVSVASMGAMAFLPLAIWKAEHSAILTGYAVVTAIWIIIRHHENIRRLMSGTEPRMDGSGR